MNTMSVDTFSVSGPYACAAPLVQPAIRVVDRPCGSGKTTSLLGSFSKDGKYLVIVPFLTEVDRVITHANVPFVQPSVECRDTTTKSSHLRKLLCDGANVVTTHKLYSIIVDMVRDGLLSDYHIIVDEVFDVCRSFDGKRPISWQEFYVGDGYATVDPLDGRVTPTAKWDVSWEEVSDTLDPRVYRYAKSGCLFLINGQYFILAMPQDLLTAGLTMTIYTFKAEGSLLLAYLDKLDVPYKHDTDPQAEGEFKRKARELVTVRTLPALERAALTYTGQDKGANGKRVSSTLQKLRERQLSNVDRGSIMLTCRKANWYLKGRSDEGTARPGPYASRSRMFIDVKWVANTTRGTNEYIHCSHLVYLWDQRLNQNIARWLGTGGKYFEDQYALTELIQWVWRSRVRRGEPIVLYLPSKRMRAIFENWLNS